MQSLRDEAERLERLRHFIDGGGVPTQGRPPTLARAQQSLLEREQAEHSARLAQLDSEVAHLESEREAVQARIDGLRDILELVTRRSSAFEQLATVGHAATQAWLQVEQERRGIETELAELRARQHVLSARRVTLGRSRASYLTERLRSVAAAQVENEQRLATLEQERLGAHTNLGRHRLRAPVSGRIQQLAVHTLGAGVVG